MGGYAEKNRRARLAFDPGVNQTGESLLIFLSPEGFMKTFIITGAFTSQQFIADLKHLKASYPNKKFLIIMDNCAIHKSQKVQEWLDSMEAANDDTFVFQWLPRYWPEMNPVEYFNNVYKEYLRKKSSKNSKEVIEDSDEFITAIKSRKDKKEYIQSFFCGEGCCYSMIIYLDAKQEYEAKHAA